MVDLNRLNLTLPLQRQGSGTLKGRLTRFYPQQPQITSTLFRGFDQGASRYVTWTVNTLSPVASATTPNLVGTLVDAHIEIP